MTPVLQRLSTLAFRVLLRLSFLGQMALVVRHDFAHVANVVLVVFAGIFVWVLLQDLDDLPAAVEGSIRPRLLILKLRCHSFSLLTSRGQWFHPSHRPWTSLHPQSPLHRAILSARLGPC